MLLSKPEHLAFGTAVTDLGPCSQMRQSESACLKCLPCPSLTSNLDASEKCCQHHLHSTDLFVLCRSCLQRCNHFQCCFSLFYPGRVAVLRRCPAPARSPSGTRQPPGTVAPGWFAYSEQKPRRPEPHPQVFSTLSLAEVAAVQARGFRRIARSLLVACRNAA